jgi:hypothetical protein
LTSFYGKLVIAPKKVTAQSIEKNGSEPMEPERASEAGCGSMKLLLSVKRLHVLLLFKKLEFLFLFFIFIFFGKLRFWWGDTRVIK